MKWFLFVLLKTLVAFNIVTLNLTILMKNNKFGIRINLDFDLGI